VAVLGIVAGVVAALAAVFDIGPAASEPARYKIEFDNAFGLNEGGDFRIGGVRAGKTTDVRGREAAGSAGAGAGDGRG
jgi:ABC-type transporter Mla subunit MlaD